MHPAPSRRPLIVAHRGASFDAPENTLAAFRLAFEQGADAIEGDFRLTADGHVVCCHDPTTGRCGDRDLTVAESTLADLRTVDVGSWKSPAFAGERMPTLAEALAIVPSGKGAFLELKTGPAIVPFVRAAIDAGPIPPSRLVVMSFDQRTVAAAKNAMPRVTVDWLTAFRRRRATGRFALTAAKIAATLRRCHADGVGLQARPDAATPALVARLRKAGAGVSVWTVDDPKAGHAFIDLGVDAITTNRPARIVRGDDTIG